MFGVFGVWLRILSKIRGGLSSSPPRFEVISTGNRRKQDQLLGRSHVFRSGRSRSAFAAGSGEEGTSGGGGKEDDLGDFHDLVWLFVSEFVYPGASAQARRAA
jgi:hypothetical protein